jgi:endonuclease V-like protein UPF0215 family
MKDLLVSGIDDGYFPIKYKGKKGKAPLVSVTYDGYKIVDVDLDFIYVDGDDATAKFNNLRKGKICILYSIIVGGFNYIIPEGKYIIFYGRKPNIIEIGNALKLHFDDKRKDIILGYLSNLVKVPTKKGSVYINTNLEISEAINIIEFYQINSKYPEPIQSAHIIGKGIGQHVNSS